MQIIMLRVRSYRRRWAAAAIPTINIPRKFAGNAALLGNCTRLFGNLKQQRWAVPYPRDETSAGTTDRPHRELSELMCSNDLEGTVAKRLDDLYEPRVRWLKIKNGDYSGRVPV